MPTVTFISHGGTETIVTASAGLSVMRAAVLNGVPGIDADCGGCCACATCQVIVDPAWSARLPPAAADEADMLESVSSLQPTSRLSCQITLTDALDGLIVTTPASQG
jgi:2Fe-2S ferredoxin